MTLDETQIAIVESASMAVGLDSTAEIVSFEVSEVTLEEEPTSDCSDCVSQAQYDELASLVSMQADQIAALEASMQNMAGLEATVNDVDSALTDMATCIADTQAVTWMTWIPR